MKEKRVNREGFEKAAREFKDRMEALFHSAYTLGRVTEWPNWTDREVLDWILIIQREHTKMEGCFYKLLDAYDKKEEV